VRLGQENRQGWVKVDGVEGKLGIREGYLEHVSYQGLHTGELLPLPGEKPSEFWYRQALLASALLLAYLQTLLTLPRGRMRFTSSEVPPGAGFRLVPEVVDAFLDAIAPSAEGGEGWGWPE